MMQNSKLKRMLLYLSLVGVGLVVGLVSVYRASVEGFYHQVRLERKDVDYQGEVDKESLFWVERERGKEEIDQGIIRGGRLLLEGKVKRGAYRLIKEMQRVRLRVSRGDCGEKGWKRERELIDRILKGISGDLRTVLEKEDRAMESRIELRCR